MSKKIALGPIVGILIIAVLLAQLPSEDVTDSKSAVKNAQRGLVTDTVVSAGGDAIGIVGEYAIDSACNNDFSQNCASTTSLVSIGESVKGVLWVGLFIGGVIGTIKFVSNRF